MSQQLKWGVFWEGSVPPKTSITKEERKSFKELRDDNSRVAIEKGIVIVVMDKKDYVQKSSVGTKSTKILQNHSSKPHHQKAEQGY